MKKKIEPPQPNKENSQKQYRIPLIINSPFRTELLIDLYQHLISAIFDK